MIVRVLVMFGVMRIVMRIVMIIWLVVVVIIIMECLNGNIMVMNDFMKV